MCEEYVMDITDYEELDEVMIYEWNSETKEVGCMVEVIERNMAVKKYNIVGDVVNHEVKIYGEEENEEDLFYNDFANYDSDDDY